jgi:hypothetical protein
MVFVASPPSNQHFIEHKNKIFVYLTHTTIYRRRNLLNFINFPDGPAIVLIERNHPENIN